MNLDCFILVEELKTGTIVRQNFRSKRDYLSPGKTLSTIGEYGKGAAEKPSASAGENLSADKSGAASSSGQAEGDLPADPASSIEEPPDFDENNEEMQ